MIGQASVYSSARQQYGVKLSLRARQLRLTVRGESKDSSLNIIFTKTIFDYSVD